MATAKDLKLRLRAQVEMRMRDVREYSSAFYANVAYGCHLGSKQCRRNLRQGTRRLPRRDPAPAECGVMSNKPSTKVHARIGHVRSLCGLAPKNGQYHIAEFKSFFTAAEEDQCAVCLARIKARGYNIAQLRKQFRTPYEVADLLFNAA